MKLKPGFITHQTGDEQIMVSAGAVKFSGMVRSNRTAAFIVDCLKAETTPEAIAAAMTERYEVDSATAARDLEAVLAVLRRIGALDE